jgi:hypothetical protein
VLSLASYQPTALALAVVVVGGEVIRVGWGGSRYWRRAWPRWLEILLAIVAAVAVYVLSVLISWWFTGTEASSARSNYSLTGGYPSTPGEIAVVLRYGLRMTARFWFGATSLYPLALKVTSLVLVAAGVATSLVAAERVRREDRRVFIGAGAWLLVLALGSLVVPFTVLFLRDDPTLRGSVLTTTGLVVGFWAALLLDRVPAAGARGRRWVEVTGVALVLALVLGCAHQINQGYFGLYLGNQRDLANANRMLSVMEQMPEFSRGGTVYVELVGLVRFEAGPEPFADPFPGRPGGSILNCSGLACQDRLVNMLNLIGGGERAFGRRSVSRDPAVAAIVSTMPSWPEPGSIRFLQRTFVIKGS